MNFYVKMFGSERSRSPMQKMTTCNIVCMLHILYTVYSVNDVRPRITNLGLIEKYYIDIITCVNHDVVGKA